MCTEFNSTVYCILKTQRFFLIAFVYLKIHNLQFFLMNEEDYGRETAVCATTKCHTMTRVENTHCSCNLCPCRTTLLRVTSETHKQMACDSLLSFPLYKFVRET